MPYDERSPEGRLLAGDPEVVGLVFRWIAVVLTAPRFWSLRPEWPDLHQEIVARVLQSLRRERFEPGKDLRVYVQAVTSYTALAALDAQRERPGDVPLPESVPDGRAGAEERLVARLFARAVLDHASGECRALIKAYFLEERGYEEIARDMGVPIGTVKSRLSRCLERFARLGAILPGRARQSRHG